MEMFISKKQKDYDNIVLSLYRCILKRNLKIDFVFSYLFLFKKMEFWIKKTKINECNERV